MGTPCTRWSGARTTGVHEPAGRARLRRLHRAAGAAVPAAQGHLHHREPEDLEAVRVASSRSGSSNGPAASSSTSRSARTGPPTRSGPASRPMARASGRCSAAATASRTPSDSRGACSSATAPGIGALPWPAPTRRGSAEPMRRAPQRWRPLVAAAERAPSHRRGSASWQPRSAKRSRDGQHLAALSDTGCLGPATSRSGAARRAPSAANGARAAEKTPAGAGRSPGEHRRGGRPGGLPAAALGAARDSGAVPRRLG